jgi:flagellar hook-basal body complex protein FliE
MVNPIPVIRPPSLPVAVELPGAAQARGAGEFGSMLSEAVGRVNGLQRTAESAIQKFLTGEDEEVHRVALAAQQAEGAFDLFLQVRNKVVQAYQEVMRMQM